MESFGPDTQSLPDIRLAESLGETSYITRCEVVTHQERRKRKNWKLIDNE